MSTTLPVAPRVRPPGGAVRAISPESVAAELDLQPGDRLVAINGHRLRDVIDYRFYGAEAELELLALKGGVARTYRVTREYGQELGFEFEDALFTSIRRCANTCDFCFVDQNPRGLRPTLYIPDDDYRLSFLFGDFITLTNLKEADWARIEEQRLSPLYVSVHATDLALRRRLLGNPRARDIRDEIRRLASIGVQVHCQVVLCPGINDGEHLDRTVRELLELYPVVLTVAVVPVGLTKFSPARDLRPMTRPEAQALIEQGKAWSRECRAKLGSNAVFLSDEVYALAGAPIPGAAYYRGFPQYENGIGMLRTMKDDIARLERRLRSARPSAGRRPIRRATAVCGWLAAPMLTEAADMIHRAVDVRLDVVPVTNEFLGERVTCSGLLAGRDIVRRVAGMELGDALILPRRALNQSGTLFVDDTSFSEVVDAVRVPVSTGQSAADLVASLGIAAGPPPAA